MTTVRTARLDDVGAVVDTYVTSWNAAFVGFLPTPRVVTAELVDRWADELTSPHPYRWWVAEADGAVVGFAGIGVSRDPIDPELGELDTIAVAPSSWRRGVGTALMSVAVDHLRNDGYVTAVLWTVAGLAQAERFYKKMGWRSDTVTRDDRRQIRYRLDLPK